MSKGITRERTGYLLQELFKLLLEHPDEWAMVSGDYQVLQCHILR